MKKFIAGLNAILFVIINFAALIGAVLLDSFRQKREKLKGKIVEIVAQVKSVAVEAKLWLYAYFAKLRIDSYSSIA